ncbi:GL19126 [Drosophila persimilis]|uniref:GL19126 n=1 Tax=Drosophila persimilis TaxID=7234 RepID=B4G6X5_DROPE|nr:GL19126 [Drosophila persimilis]
MVHCLSGPESCPEGRTASAPIGCLEWTAIIERTLAHVNPKTRRVKYLVNDGGHIDVRKRFSWPSERATWNGMNGRVK